MNTIDNVWRMKKKEIGTHLPSKQTEMWEKVYDAWYSVSASDVKDLYNSMLRCIEDVIQEKGGATKY